MNPILLFAIVTAIGSVAASVFVVLMLKARGLSNYDSVPYVLLASGAGCLAVAVNMGYFDHHHAASAVSVVIQFAIATAALILTRRSATKPTTT